MTAYLETANRISTLVLEEALNSFPIAVLIGLVVWALLKFARGLNASTRHAIWWAALFAVLCVGPLRFGILSQRASIAETESTPVTALADALPAPATAPAVAVEAEYTPPTPEADRGISAGFLPLAFAIVLCLWLLVQSVRIAFSYVYLRRLKSAGIKPGDELRVNFDEWRLTARVGREVRLLLSDRLESPVAAGFRSPAVLIPQSLVSRLEGADLDHMLLHELAHLARRDDWTNLAVRFAWGLFGFHPVVAFILRRIDEERELACDDWVVEMTGKARPYAVSLSKLVEFRLMQSREMLATGIGGRRSHVAGRIERLLKAGSHFDSRLSLARIAMTISVLAVAIALGTQAPGWIAFAQESQALEPAPTAPPAPAAAQAPPSSPAPADAQAPPAPRAAPRAVRSAQPQPPPSVVEPLEPPREPNPAAPAPPPPPRVRTAGIAAVQPPQPLQPPPPRVRTAGIAAMQPPQPLQPPQPRVRTPGTAAMQPLQPLQPPPPPAAENRTSFLKALSDAGYSDLPVEAIIELKNNSISADFLVAANQAGWGRLPIAQLIELRNAGVSGEYLRSAKASGIRSLTLKDVVVLRTQGVRMDSVREIHSLGFGPYDARQTAEFHLNGVRADYFRSLKDAGFTNLEPAAIIEARRHNVRGEDLVEAKKYGSSLTLQQIIRLKQAGVI